MEPPGFACSLPPPAPSPEEDEDEDEDEDNFDLDSSNFVSLLSLEVQVCPVRR